MQTSPGMYASAAQILVSLLLLLLGCATSSAKPATPSAEVRRAYAPSYPDRNPEAAQTVEAPGAAAAVDSTDSDKERKARVLATPEPVPLEFGFPNDTVVHQVILGPEARNRATRGHASVVMWAVRDCSRDGQCRDHLLLFGEMRNQSSKRAKRTVVDEFTAEAAIVNAIKFIKAPVKTSDQWIHSDGVYEVSATNAFGRFSFCVWPIGYSGYQVQKLSASTDELSASCSLDPPIDSEPKRPS
jgi:hypothetical protein